MAAFVATHMGGTLLCKWNTDGPPTTYTITVSEKDDPAELPPLPAGATEWRRVAIVVGGNGELLS